MVLARSTPSRQGRDPGEKVVGASPLPWDMLDPGHLAVLKALEASRPHLCSSDARSNPLLWKRSHDSPLQGLSGLAHPSKELKICLWSSCLWALVCRQAGSPECLPHNSSPVRHQDSVLRDIRKIVVPRPAIASAHLLRKTVKKPYSLF